MNKTTGVVIAAAFALACWCVLLGGVAALNASCNEDVNSAVADRLTLQAYIWNAVSMYGTTGVQAPVCSRIFSLQWWLIVIQFCVCAACLFVAADLLSMYHSKGGFLGMISILSVFYWMYANKFLTLSWELWGTNADSTVYSRIQCTTAGYILLAFANAVWLFVLSAVHPGEEEQTKAAAGANMA